MTESSYMPLNNYGCSRCNTKFPLYQPCCYFCGKDFHDRRDFDLDVDANCTRKVVIYYCQECGQEWAKVALSIAKNMSQPLKVREIDETWIKAMTELIENRRKQFGHKCKDES